MGLLTAFSLKTWFEDKFGQIRYVLVIGPPPPLITIPRVLRKLENALFFGYPSVAHKSFIKIHTVESSAELSIAATARIYQEAAFF